MSMIGLAGSPGTAVRPTCSMTAASPSRAAAVLSGAFRIVRAKAGRKARWLGVRSFELLAEGGELLLDFGELLAEAGYFCFEGNDAISGGVAGGIRGRGHPRQRSGLGWFAGEEMSVAGFFGAGLAREDAGQRGLALG